MVKGPSYQVSKTRIKYWNGIHVVIFELLDSILRYNSHKGEGFDRVNVTSINFVLCHQRDELITMNINILMNSLFLMTYNKIYLLVHFIN